jgi:hypothetical protein
MQARPRIQSNSGSRADGDDIRIGAGAFMGEWKSYDRSGFRFLFRSEARDPYQLRRNPRGAQPPWAALFRIVEHYAPAFAVFHSSNIALFWLEENPILIPLIIGAYIAVPILAVHGWMRWKKTPQASPSKLSFIGFTLASVSATLSLASAVYSFARGGFAYYHPLLLAILGAGLVISGLGLISSLCGIAQKSTVRWHAPVLSLLMLLLWLFWLSGE